MQSIKTFKNKIIKSIKNKTLPFVNLYTKHSSIDNNLIVLVSFFGRNIGDNPGGIYDYLKDSGYEVVFLVKRPEDYPDVNCVRMYSMKSYILLRKAKLIISNSRMTPKWIKKEGQTYIQTWHGTPLKRLVHDLEVFNMPSADSIEDYFKLFDDEVKRWDYLLSPCPFTTEKLRSAFQYEGEVLEIGYPRNQKLFDYKQEDISEIKKKLGLEVDDKVILYAPTYRDNLNRGVGKYYFNTPLEFDKLRKEFPEYKILIRYHYSIVESEDFENENIINVSQYDDIADLYLVSDVLITDYSSVFFDYSILEKPFLFFMYDIEEYANDLRGFYLDVYNDFPIKPVTTTEGIIEQLKNIDNYNFKDFSDEYNPKENIHCKDKLLSCINEIMESK